MWIKKIFASKLSFFLLELDNGATRGSPLQCTEDYRLSLSAVAATAAAAGALTRQSQQRQHDAAKRVAVPRAAHCLQTADDR